MNAAVSTIVCFESFGKSLDVPSSQHRSSREASARRPLRGLLPTRAWCRGVAPELRSPHEESGHHRGHSLHRLCQGHPMGSLRLRRFSTWRQSGALQSARHPSCGGAARGVFLLRASVPSHPRSSAGSAALQQAAASGRLCPCDATPLGEAPSVDAPVSRRHIGAARHRGSDRAPLGSCRGRRRTCPQS